MSFELGRGEVLGVVGEGGSGKSVTCRAILGLLPVRARVAGCVPHGGRDLVALRPAVRFSEARAGVFSEVLESDPAGACIVLIGTASCARKVILLAHKARKAADHGHRV